jgi:hypothetical protein
MSEATWSEDFVFNRIEAIKKKTGDEKIIAIQEFLIFETSKELKLPYEQIVNALLGMAMEVFLNDKIQYDDYSKEQWELINTIKKVVADNIENLQ